MVRFAIFTIFMLMTLTAGAQKYEELAKAGTVHLENGETDKAIEKYTAALERAGDDASTEFVYANLALAYMKKGDAKRAEELLTKGIARNPESTKMVLFRGNLYLEQGMAKKAKADYNAVLSKEPFNEEALYYRAYIHSLEKKHDKAEEDYYKILSANPSNDKAYYALALLYYNEKNYSQATLLLNNLIERSPQVADYYLACSNIEKTNKRYELALAYIEQGMASCEESEALLTEKAELLIALGEKEEARRVLDSIVRKGSYSQRVISLYKKL